MSNVNNVPNKQKIVKHKMNEVPLCNEIFEIFIYTSIPSWNISWSVSIIKRKLIKKILSVILLYF